MKIENERDIEDYFRTLLDITDPRQKQLCEKFILMRCGRKESKKSKTKSRDDLTPMLSMLSLNEDKVLLYPFISIAVIFFLGYFK